MWLVSVTSSQVCMGSRCVKFCVIALTLSYWSLEVQHGTSWQKTSEDLLKRIVALHKDGVCYKKIAKTLKLSCSTVDKTIQRFNRTGSTQNRPRHGRPKKLSARAQRHVQRLCLGNRRMSAGSIAAEVWGGGGGSKQVRSTKTSVSCLKSSMVVGVSWSGAAWVLLTCTVTYWSRAGSPPFGDWAAGQYSNMITTTALLKKLRVKVMDWPSMSPDLKPIEHLWGILKQKVEERKVSNIHQLCDVIMEEWKRTPVVTCEALVNSMPKRVKAVLENNGGHRKYWHFGPNLQIFAWGVLTFVASSLDIKGCVLSYFVGKANLNCYTSCTLTTLHYSKVSFLQRYNKIYIYIINIYIKCEGCTHFCEILYNLYYIEILHIFLKYMHGCVSIYTL